MNYQHILYAASSGVAEITLNRPDLLNALTYGPGSNGEELVSALSAANADPEIACILLAANGAAFSAGGNLKENRIPANSLESYLFVDQAEGRRQAVRDSRKPVVAAISGLCVGGGLGLAASCDLLIAADNARFGLPEGRFGAGGIGPVAVRIGVPWAKYLMLTGEMIDARRARAIGLVLEIARADQLLERTRNLAARIAAMPREALLLNKACVDAMDKAMFQDARMAGRSSEMLTMAMIQHARAPDQRLFADIIRDEGVSGLKHARDKKFSDRWLDGVVE